MLEKINHVAVQSSIAPTGEQLRGGQRDDAEGRGDSSLRVPECYRVARQRSRNPSRPSRDACGSLTPIDAKRLAAIPPFRCIVGSLAPGVRWCRALGLAAVQRCRKLACLSHVSGRRASDVYDTNPVRRSRHPPRLLPSGSTSETVEPPRTTRCDATGCGTLFREDPSLRAFVK